MGQYCVIGLGSFGYFLATKLYQMDHDVLAVDINAEVVQRIKDEVSQAVCGNVLDKRLLGSLGLEDADAVIVSLGDRIDASILVTLYLKELRVKEIIAKAVTEDHAKILAKIGATQVVYPERDTAFKVARMLDNPGLMDTLSIAEGYSIVEIAPPRSFIGKSLKELDLRNTYNVQVVMVREVVPERIHPIPDGFFIIKDSDYLVVMGKDEDIKRIKSA